MMVDTRVVTEKIVVHLKHGGQRTSACEVVFGSGHTIGNRRVCNFYHLAGAVGDCPTSWRAGPYVIGRKCCLVRKICFFAYAAGFYLGECLVMPPATAAGPVTGAKMLVCFR